MMSSKRGCCACLVCAETRVIVLAGSSLYRGTEPVQLVSTRQGSTTTRQSMEHAVSTQELTASRKSRKTPAGTCRISAASSRSSSNGGGDDILVASGGGMVVACSQKIPNNNLRQINNQIIILAANIHLIRYQLVARGSRPARALPGVPLFVQSDAV